MTRFKLNKGLDESAPIVDISKMTKQELLTYCGKHLGGDWSRVRKADLVRILNRHMRDRKIEKLLN